jgi:alkylation response protein AidB-like acyl-CoA dehydrogenase
MPEVRPAPGDDIGGTADKAVGFELVADTVAGREITALAEEHAEVFAQRADKHDRAGSFPFENFQEMQASSFLAATVPTEFGGLGVTSVHDVMVAISRLARGDASTAIAANMHITGVLGMVHVLRRVRAEGDEGAEGALADLLSRAGSGSAVMCFPLTEQGTDQTAPQTEATPRENGYVLNGRKVFGTLSPAAQVFFPSVRVPKPGGGYLSATAVVPRDTPGLRIEDNWDALGMCASGSNDVTFTDCFIPAGQLFAPSDTYGTVAPGYVASALTVNVPLVASFLGIAEAARTHAARAAERRKGPRARRLADRSSIQQLMAGIDVDLAVCRALMDRTGRLVDAFLARDESDVPEVGALHELMKEAQCAKYVVNRTSVDVVDRAMTVCGGGAYLTGHPLARLYRDARAGAFMQPFSPHEALEYIGKVGLGLEPVLDR